MEPFALIFLWAAGCLFASVLLLMMAVRARRRERAVRRVRVPAVIVGEEFSADGAIDEGM